jgi:hypothetical protein
MTPRRFGFFLLHMSSFAIGYFAIEYSNYLLMAMAVGAAFAAGMEF